MRAQIIGTGSCLPEKIVTNDYLSTIVETSDEWISSRTGIRQRHISIDETTASLSTEAGRRALEDAGVKAEDLDLIIVATCTPDTLVPNTACLVQSELGAVNATAFDISAACSGFVFAMNLVDAYMQSGMYRMALVIGAETLSRIVDWKDRSTCVLFADGAGAAVVRAAETGVSAATLGSDGTRGGVIYVKKPGEFQSVCAGAKTDGFPVHGRRGCFQVRGEDDSRSDPGDAGQGGLDGSGGGLVPAPSGQCPDQPEYRQKAAHLD